MSFSIAETLSTMNAGLSSTASAVVDFSTQWGGWAVTAIHQGINTHVVGTISSIFASTASTGPLAGPAIVLGGTVVSALVAHKLYNSASRIAQVAGFALGVGAGVATVGAVGVLVGSVGVAAYVAGGTVTAATLLL